MTDFTTALRLALPDFDISPWHDDVNNNFTILDAAFRALTGILTQGVWDNSIAYTAGQNVIDPVTGLIWTVVVPHTSAAAPTTFAQDRTANPTFWVAFTSVAANKGQWLTATPYNTNDFVYDANRFGIVTTAYTSGATYNADVAAGKIVTLVDVSFYVSSPDDGYTYGIDTDVWVRLNTAVPGADYDFDTTVGGTPASGLFRYNNATISLVSEIRIHKTDLKGFDQSSFITMIAQPGIDLFLGSEKIESKWHVFNCIALPTDSGTFYTIPVVFKQMGVTLASGDTCRFSPLGGAGSKVTTDDTAPVGPLDGQMWWRSSNGRLYVYYDDGTSAQWVEASGSNDTGDVINLAGYSVSVVGTAVQSIPSNIDTKITNLSTIDHDPSGFWSTGSQRFQPTRAGLYLISARIGLIAEVDKNLHLRLNKNGVLYCHLAGNSTPAVVTQIIGGAQIVAMNGSTDFLELSVQHTNVAATNLLVTDRLTSFNATYLGSAGMPQPEAATVRRGLLWGSEIGNSVVDATNDINFYPGECNSMVAPYANMALTTVGPMAKRLDALWTVGHNGGGLDQGAIANTSYSCHRIENIDDGAVDHLFSLATDDKFIVTMTIASPCVVTCQNADASATENHGLQAGCPIKFSSNGLLPTGVTAGVQYFVQTAGLTATAFRISLTNGGADINTSGTQSGNHVCQEHPVLPAGYTQFRRVGSIIRSAGVILPFLQNDDNFKLVTHIPIAAGLTTVASVLFNTAVPYGVELRPVMTWALTTNTNSAYLGKLGSANTGVADVICVSIGSTALPASRAGYPLTPMFYTDRARQLYIDRLVSTGTMIQSDVDLVGWIDKRGKM